MSLIKSVAVSNCRLSTYATGAMFFDEVIDFSAYAGTLGDTPYYLEFVDSGGKKCTGYCADAGGGEAVDSELISGWTNGGYETFTVNANNHDIDSAINSITSGRCISSQFTSGKILKNVINLTVNSGAVPQINLANAVGAGGLTSINMSAGVNTVYLTGFSTYNGILLFSGTAADFSALCSCKYMTDVPATGLHLVGTQDGSTRTLTPETGFNPNTIASINIYVVDRCLFQVSNEAFGSWDDQVSSASPTTQGNGRRWAISSLDGALTESLGSFTPTDVSQAQADALMAFYSALDGDSWTSGAAGSGADAWMGSRDVNDWYGVTVAGGVVTSISLANNNLVGSAGTILDPLAASLVTVDVGQNSLTGFDSSALTAVTAFDIADNSLGQSVVATILADRVTAGQASGTIVIDGTNSAPTPAGVTSLHALETSGVTVTYSTILMENTGSFYAITANGDSTIRSTATDFSGQTGKYVVAYDGTNDKYAFAYGHAADDAEAFGTELAGSYGNYLDGYDVAFTQSGTNITSAIKNQTTSRAIAYFNPGLLAGELFRLYLDLSYPVTLGLIDIKLRTVLNSGTDYKLENGAAAGSIEHIETCTEDYGSFELYRTSGGRTNFATANLTLKKYTALGTDALQLRAAATGSTRNWTSIESGFNPNTISKIEVFNA